MILLRSLDGNFGLAALQLRTTVAYEACFTNISPDQVLAVVHDTADRRHTSSQKSAGSASPLRYRRIASSIKRHATCTASAPNQRTLRARDDCCSGRFRLSCSCSPFHAAVPPESWRALRKPPRNGSSELGDGHGGLAPRSSVKRWGTCPTGMLPCVCSRSSLVYSWEVRPLLNPPRIRTTSAARIGLLVVICHLPVELSIDAR